MSEIELERQNTEFMSAHEQLSEEHKIHESMKGKLEEMRRESSAPGFAQVAGR